MKNRSLVLLSGEGTTVPDAEARALFLAYDPGSSFERPDPRVLLAESAADPFRIGRRIAFARRAGVLVDEPREALPMLAGRRVRFRCFDLENGFPRPDPAHYLRGAAASVDLQHPELELTLVRGDAEYLAVTSPGTMVQGWAQRRPRKRPFFHPSAIFPKLSRALVNLSRVREGEVFLEPFAGTGSLAIEASKLGARVVAVDVAERMARGAHSNMVFFGERWMAVVRADAARLPLAAADAVATDIPYGRASSTRGLKPEEILRAALESLGPILKEGSHAVFMHPQSLRVDGGGSFGLVEEHHLHVHKLLTRTITVLEKR